MKHLRSLAVVLAVVALALSVGTGAFSATSIDRGLQGSVVSDDEAYVGYETNKLTVDDGDREEILTVTNRLTESIDVTDVSVSNTGDLTVKDLSTPTGIDPTNSDSIQATFKCSDNVDPKITVSVTVESTSTAVAIDGDTTKRKFEVDCQPPTPTPTPTATATKTP